MKLKCSTCVHLHFFWLIYSRYGLLKARPLNNYVGKSKSFIVFLFSFITFRWRTFTYYYFKGCRAAGDLF